LSNFVVRVISAIVMIGVGYSAMILDLRARWAVMTLLLVLGAWEFSRMVGIKLGGKNFAVLAALAVLGFSAAQYPDYFAVQRDLWQWGIAVLATLVFTLLGFRYLDISAMAPWIFVNLYGIAYFGLYAGSIYGLFQPVTGWRGVFPLLTVQALMAAADTGAYMSGKAFGKHKLCPTISSGKTVEGAVGGAIITTAVALLLGPRLLGITLPQSFGFGLLMSATAIMGDLFMSILKRYTGVKDSSHLIPGHGGVLDRFDSLFFSAPAAVFYLRLFQ
jgi:phosphatidate cytidylyltransferase